MEGLWPEGREGGWTLESAWAMVRAAYGQGYVDALSDSPPIPAEDVKQRSQFFWSKLPV